MISDLINNTRKSFFEKKHSFGFVFQKQYMYIPIFSIQNIDIIDLLITESCILVICVYILNKNTHADL